MAKKPKTLIFDFDGTIADSFKVIVEIFEQITGRENPIEDSEMAHLRGLPPTEVARRLKVPLWRAPIFLFRGRSLMQRRLTEIKPFAGIETTLKNLHASGHKIYITSSNSALNIHRFLRANNLNHLINGVYGGASLFGKAKLLARLLAKHKLKPEHCFYIGDETRDIEAARIVKIPFIAVAWGFADTQILEKMQPLALARNPKDLVKIIEWVSE